MNDEHTRMSGSMSSLAHCRIFNSDVAVTSLLSKQEILSSSDFRHSIAYTSEVFINVRCSLYLQH